MCLARASNRRFKVAYSTTTKNAAIKSGAGDKILACNQQTLPERPRCDCVGLLSVCHHSLCMCMYSMIQWGQLMTNHHCELAI